MSTDVMLPEATEVAVDLFTMDEMVCFITTKGSNRRLKDDGDDRTRRNG